MRASAPFSETRNEMLQDPEFAAMYLEEYLAEDPEAFNVALKHVADAYPGGLSALSRTAHLNRESLHRALRRGGNPNLKTLTKFLDALGLRISVVPQASVPMTVARVGDTATIDIEEEGAGAGEAYTDKHAGVARETRQNRGRYFRTSV